MRGVDECSLELARKSELLLGGLTTGIGVSTLGDQAPGPDALTEMGIEGVRSTGGFITGTELEISALPWPGFGLESRPDSEADIFLMVNSEVSDAEIWLAT